MDEEVRRAMDEREEEFQEFARIFEGRADEEDAREAFAEHVREEIEERRRAERRARRRARHALVDGPALEVAMRSFASAFDAWDQVGGAAV